MFIDITNQKFGRLTTVRRVATVKKRAMWECVCECGNMTITAGHLLRRGDTRSCGCLGPELASQRGKILFRKHGHAVLRTPEYRAWASMKERCLNPRHRFYSYYGGRGITICERWMLSFEKFLSDMGSRPSSKHSLDRRDNNGNYEPENCRWATAKVQMHNRRLPLMIINQYGTFPRREAIAA